MKQRLLTAALAIPIVLGAVFSGHLFVFAVLSILIASLGIIELGRLFSTRPPVFGLALLLLTILFVAQGPTGQAQLFAVALLLLIQAAGIYCSLLALTTPNWTVLSVASMWIAAPLCGLLYLHGPGRTWDFHWQTPVLLALLPLWAGDTAGIFAGKAWGKRLLAPTISPKKTWAGAVANFIACVATGAGVAAAIGLPWWLGLACGLAAGVLGQAGDLFESYLKRQTGVKDSGSILPGHGGVLDRIDSLLFTALPVALIVTLYNALAK